MQRVRAALFVLLAVACLGTGRAAQCAAQSGPHTTALVELYTSEGCDSCPPADRWLASLARRGHSAERVVPIALHVDYWDYLGWKDPYAQARFSARQRRLAAVHRARLVYTPQVMLQGADFRGWRGAQFDEALERIHRTPAAASIALRLVPAADRGIRAQVSVRLASRDAVPGAELFVAAYESGLASAVAAGENRGRTLAHDYVVRAWAGPFPLGPGGRLDTELSLDLPPQTRREHAGVVAFVQDRATARVLQALMRPAC